MKDGFDIVDKDEIEGLPDHDEELFFYAILVGSPNSAYHLFQTMDDKYATLVAIAAIKRGNKEILSLLTGKIFPTLLRKYALKYDRWDILDPYNIFDSRSIPAIEEDYYPL